MTKNTKNTLGRGLDALLANDYLSVDTEGASHISEIPIADIIPNQEQPRTIFEENALKELADSIQQVGIIQPITLSVISGQHAPYKIISGERRYRAAKQIGLATIPAYIRTVEDEKVMEMALIENIQREDLNAIEIALCFKKLIDTYQLTQDALSVRVAKKRSTISNYLRLLRLPAEIQVGLKDGKVDMGHAKAILALDDAELQLEIYKKVLNERLSVRQVEDLVKAYNENKSLPKTNGGKRVNKKSAEEFKELSEKFSSLFSTKVSMNCNEVGKGKISIHFSSEQELEKILSLLDKL